MNDKEKGIDLKYFIDEDIKKWYNKKIKTFYFVITKEGEILFFSEDSLDFFGLKSIYEVEDSNIDKYIGKKNWNILQKNLEEFNQNDDYLCLEEKVQNTFFLKVTWKKFVEMEDDRYILVFKVNEESEEKKQDAITNQVSENKTDIKIELLYKILFDNLDISLAVIKDGRFFYKNKSFDTLSSKLNFNTLNEFMNIIDMNNTTADTSNTIIDENVVISGVNLSLSYAEFFDGYKYLSIREADSCNQDANLKKIEEFEADLDQKNNFIKLLQEKLLEIKEETSSIIDSEQKFYSNAEVTKTIDLKYHFNRFEKIVADTTNYLTKMSEIANFIENISVKIHLISINAAIESARSGEAGKGFAVISREIAKLSDATKNHTKMIDKQIKEIKKFYSSQNTESDLQNEQAITYIERLTQVDQRMGKIIKSVKDSVIEKIEDIIILKQF